MVLLEYVVSIRRGFESQVCHCRDGLCGKCNCGLTDWHIVSPVHWVIRAASWYCICSKGRQIIPPKRERGFPTALLYIVPINRRPYGTESSVKPTRNSHSNLHAQPKRVSACLFLSWVEVFVLLESDDYSLFPLPAPLGPKALFHHSHTLQATFGVCCSQWPLTVYHHNSFYLIPFYCVCSLHGSF